VLWHCYASDRINIRFVKDVCYSTHHMQTFSTGMWRKVPASCDKRLLKRRSWTDGGNVAFSEHQQSVYAEVLWLCFVTYYSSYFEGWGVDVVICLERGADCFCMVQLLPLPSQNPSSLASFKSKLVLRFWYWLTQVVLEKRQLIGCSSSTTYLWHGCCRAL